jgi:uncharacterized protein (TIGR02996 family)
MFTEESLQHAILEDPDDDAPRLAYADWLDEHADPDRAEFIRAQIERARLPEGDPRRFELEKREAQLLRLHKKAWRRPLPSWARRDAVFHRGFVVKVYVEAEAFLASGDALFTAQPVVDVGLRHTRGHLAAVAASPLLRRLQGLSLIWGEVGPEVAEAVASSPHVGNLKRLDLQGSCIGDRGARALANCPNLGSLDSLCLASCSIGVPGVRALAATRNLPRLTILDLAGNPVGDAAARALANSRNLPHLRILGLVDTGIEEAGALALIASRNLPSLALLDLDDNFIGEEAGRALEERFPHAADL